MLHVCRKRTSLSRLDKLKHRIIVDLLLANVLKHQISILLWQTRILSAILPLNSVQEMLSGPPLSHVIHPAAANCRPLFFWMASFIMLNLQLLQGTTSPLEFRVCSLALTWWQCILVWQQLTGSPWLLCYVRVCMRRWQQQQVPSFPHQKFLECLTKPFSYELLGKAGQLLCICAAAQEVVALWRRMISRLCYWCGIYTQHKQCNDKMSLQRNT